MLPMATVLSSQCIFGRAAARHMVRQHSGVIIFLTGSPARGLVATALVRMARVVDRARLLAAIAHDGNWEKLGATKAQLRTALERQGKRARYAEWSIAVLYVSVVVFILTCLSIVVDHAMGGSLNWLLEERS